MTSFSKIKYEETEEEEEEEEDIQWGVTGGGGWLNWLSIGLKFKVQAWPEFESRKARQEHKENVVSFSESKMLCWLAVDVPNPRPRTHVKDHVARK